MGYVATLGSDERTRAMNVGHQRGSAAARCTLVDACAAYDPLNSADHAHPDDAGHAQIARAFLVAMIHAAVGAGVSAGGAEAVATRGWVPLMRR
jgi:hypothetical protein